MNNTATAETEDIETRSLGGKYTCRFLGESLESADLTTLTRQINDRALAEGRSGKAYHVKVYRGGKLITSIAVEGAPARSRIKAVVYSSAR